MDGRVDGGLIIVADISLRRGDRDRHREVLRFRSFFWDLACGMADTWLYRSIPRYFHLLVMGRYGLL